MNTGREKLCGVSNESVRAVLETDGTQVDDSEYFRSLPDNTVFLLLRPGERWVPAGIDVIRAGNYLFTFLTFLYKIFQKSYISFHFLHALFKPAIKPFIVHFRKKWNFFFGRLFGIGCFVVNKM